MAEETAAEAAEPGGDGILDSAPATQLDMLPNEIGVTRKAALALDDMTPSTAAALKRNGSTTSTTSIDSKDEHLLNISLGVQNEDRGIKDPESAPGSHYPSSSILTALAVVEPFILHMSKNMGGHLDVLKENGFVMNTVLSAICLGLETLGKKMNTNTRGLSERLQSLENSLQGVSVQLDKLGSKGEELRKRTDDEAKSNRQELKDLRAEHQRDKLRLAEQLAEKGKLIEAKAADLSLLEERMKELNNVSDALDAAINRASDRLQSQLDAHQAGFDRLEERVEVQDETIGSTTGAIAELSSAYRLLDDNIAAAREDVLGTRRAVKEVQYEVGLAKSQLKEEHTEIQEEKQRRNSLRRRVSVLNTQLVDLDLLRKQQEEAEAAAMEPETDEEKRTRLLLACISALNPLGDDIECVLNGARVVRGSMSRRSMQLLQSVGKEVDSFKDKVEEAKAKADLSNTTNNNINSNSKNEKRSGEQPSDTAAKWAAVDKKEFAAIMESLSIKLEDVIEQHRQEEQIRGARERAGGGANNVNNNDEDASALLPYMPKGLTDYECVDGKRELLSRLQRALEVICAYVSEFLCTGILNLTIARLQQDISSKKAIQRELVGVNEEIKKMRERLQKIENTEETYRQLPPAVPAALPPAEPERDTHKDIESRQQQESDDIDKQIQRQEAQPSVDAKWAEKNFNKVWVELQKIEDRGAARMELLQQQLEWQRQEYRPNPRLEEYAEQAEREVMRLTSSSTPSVSRSSTWREGQGGDAQSQASDATDNRMEGDNEDDGDVGEQDVEDDGEGLKEQDGRGPADDNEEKPASPVGQTTKKTSFAGSATAANGGFPAGGGGGPIIVPGPLTRGITIPREIVGGGDGGLIPRELAGAISPYSHHGSNGFNNNDHGPTTGSVGPPDSNKAGPHGPPGTPAGVLSTPPLNALSTYERKISSSLPAVLTGLSDAQSRLTDLNFRVDKIMAAQYVTRADLKSMLKSKIEKKDLKKLASMIASGHLAMGGSGADVLASRLNMLPFRCLSCDRPLPDVSTKAKLAHLDPLESKPLPRPKTAEAENTSKEPFFSADMTATGSSLHRPARGLVSSDTGQQSTGRKSEALEDGPYLSKYPRMMPPPNRVRSAAGGGGAGLSDRYTHPNAISMPAVA